MILATSRTMRLLPLIVLWLCLFSSARAQERDLLGPLRAGNTTVLERLGARMGASGLARELASPERPRVIAAIRASLGAEDAWALLAPLARAAAHPDRSIATLAAETGATIAQRVDQITLEHQEVSARSLVSLEAQWLEVAGHRLRWVDIRVYALEAAAHLHRLVPPGKRAPLDWAPYLSDPDPEMRAAAFALAPEDLDLWSRSLAALRDDQSAVVALSAGQALCGPLGAMPRALPKLESEILQRLQDLAVDKRFAVALRADLAPCLVDAGDVRSRRALARLLQQSPPMLRRSLLALIRGK